jgi:hypothetical protein
MQPLHILLCQVMHFLPVGLESEGHRIARQRTDATLVGGHALW